MVDTVCSCAAAERCLACQWSASIISANVNIRNLDSIPAVSWLMPRNAALPVCGSIVEVLDKSMYPTFTVILKRAQQLMICKALK